MMENSMLIGLSRQTALRRQMDIIANNLANLGTAGFRGQTMLFAEHLSGRLSLHEAAERIARRTRALARRQMAWFRRDPRIRWFPAGEGGAMDAVDDIEEHLRG
jgi:tRNA A37 N6-isopentenylltransferase MiaA